MPSGQKRVPSYPHMPLDFFFFFHLHSFLYFLWTVRLWFNSHLHKYSNNSDNNAQHLQNQEICHMSTCAQCLVILFSLKEQINLKKYLYHNCKSMNPNLCELPLLLLDMRSNTIRQLSTILLLKHTIYVAQHISQWFMDTENIQLSEQHRNICCCQNFPQGYLKAACGTSTSG